MNQIICPKCGGANTSSVVDQNKDIPENCFNESQQPSINDTVATLPSLYCHDCQSDFGGDHRDRMANTRQIILNTYKKGTASQNLTFSKTTTGATIEGPFLCYYPDLPEIYIDQQQWQQLLQDFYALFIMDWQSTYTAIDTADDLSWDLKIIFENREPFLSQGQGCYPPYWAAMMDLFVGFGLPNIGNKLGQNFLQLQAQKS
nr:hypothetical protein [uncultured Acetobacterium sp.]